MFPSGYYHHLAMIRSKRLTQNALLKLPGRIVRAYFHTIVLALPTIELTLRLPR